MGHSSVTILTSNGSVLSDIQQEYPPLGADQLLGLSRDQRPGVEPSGGKERDPLVVASLVAWVFPVANQEHAPIKVEIRPFDPANLVEPHCFGYCKLHDPSHWHG